MHKHSTFCAVKSNTEHGHMQAFTHTLSNAKESSVEWHSCTVRPGIAFFGGAPTAVKWASDLGSACCDGLNKQEERKSDWIQMTRDVYLSLLTNVLLLAGFPGTPFKIAILLCDPFHPGLSAGAFGSWRVGDDALGEIEAHQSELKLGLAQKHAALAAAAAAKAAAAGE
eukprot:scaffold117086_cov17-Tisochrysis_lutea.AAC.1